MPRRRLVLSDRFPYHVASRTNNKEWFQIPLEQCWQIFCGALSEASLKYEAEIFAFVLMANHFHLILATPNSNLGDIMRDLLTTVSKRITERAGRINHLFGSRYTWSLLPNATSIAYVTKYVFRNPVRASAASCVEDYRYSTLNEQTLVQPVMVSGVNEEWRFVPKHRSEKLNWLNQPVPSELEAHIRNGLKRREFAFSKHNSAQKQLRELKSIYGVENS